MRLAHAVALIATAAPAVAASQDTFAIPGVEESVKRAITIDDVVTLRHIDTLSISPDGGRFAIFVRQGIPSINDFRTGWFVGSVHGDALTYVGDAGHVGPGTRANGQEHGEISGGESRWSPDGQWIAYALARDGEVQLWRSRADGTLQEQLTHNVADVQEFAWRKDGRTLYFTVGMPRTELHARAVAKAWAGYRYDTDLNVFTDAMKFPLPHPKETSLAVWVFTFDHRREREGGELDRAAFAQIKAERTGGVAPLASFYEDAAVTPVARADGALAWLIRERPASRHLRLVASLSTTRASPTKCTDQRCSGVIERVWWSEDGKRIFFWRHEGLDESSQGFYAWSPRSGVVSTIWRTPDDYFPLCMPAARDRLICVRETKIRPEHLVAIDYRKAALEVLADVNPQFRNIRLGKVERLEWDNPKFDWNEPGGRLEGLFPERAQGYILYPPDFDSRKKYPVFIEPYIAHGFRSTYLSEHALHVYAAKGFVVLDLAFPIETAAASERWGAALVKQLYSAELDFPLLSMYSESTLRGLDTVAKRGFTDERRVGIGGVSHGTFVPLYLMQKHDRIAAISISSPTWGPHMYYWHTRKLRADMVASFGKIGYEGDWIVKPEGAGREFWKRIDIADHIDAIKAPILMNLADVETFALLRLIRHLEDAGKPYDAYVYPNETHQKWQPAHLRTIMNRNLDWFRFWLQDYEDPAPTKAEQYAYWRVLRELRVRSQSR